MIIMPPIALNDLQLIMDAIDHDLTALICFV